MSEIFTGYFTKHNLKKDYLEKLLGGKFRDKEVHVVIKMFFTKFCLFLGVCKELVGHVSD